MSQLTLKEKLSFYKTSSYKKPFHLLIRSLAKYWLKLNPQVKVVAVVGSFGKTTTAQIASQLLGLKAGVVVTDINLDTIYNIPLTILKLRPWRHRYLVLEVGVDHRKEMEFHLELFRPDIVILTGITPVHAEKKLMGSIRGIMKEKGRILKALSPNGWIVANFDDRRVVRMIRDKKRVLFYSLKNKKADFYGYNLRIIRPKRYKLITKFALRGKKNNILTISGNFLGKQFVQSFLAAAALGFLESINLKEIKTLASHFHPLKGRMSTEILRGRILLINDSLRANPASVKAGLEALSLIPKYSKKEKKIALLGEMGELGKYAQREHRKVGRLVVKLGIDYFIGVGELMKLAVEEARRLSPKGRKQFWFAKDVVEAVEILKSGVGISSGDVLYLKGSLLKHMERVIMLLSKEKVNCRVVSCQFYHSCYSCRYRLRGG